jgi:penicillin-binding protein 1C
MLHLFREAGKPRREPPATPDCGPGSEGSRTHDSVHIVSPLRGLVYTQRAAHPTPLALRADGSMTSQGVYWFAGNAFIGRAQAGENLAWSPSEPGRYLLRAVDEHGEADTRELEIEVVP